MRNVTTRRPPSGLTTEKMADPREYVTNECPRPPVGSQLGSLEQRLNGVEEKLAECLDRLNGARPEEGRCQPKEESVYGQLDRVSSAVEHIETMADRLASSI